MVDHIKYLSITAIHFEKGHPALRSFLSRVSKEKELHTIIIQVESPAVKYLGEQKFYNGFVSQKEVGDRMEITFITESLEGFARWYMLFGERADIITPKKLTAIVKKNLDTLSKKIK